MTAPVLQAGMRVRLRSRHSATGELLDVVELSEPAGTVRWDNGFRQPCLLSVLEPGPGIALCPTCQQPALLVGGDA